MRGKSSLWITCAVVVIASTLSSIRLLAGAPPATGTAAPSGPAASAAAAPNMDAADAAMPARSDRVVSYTMRAELVPETHVVRGTGTIVWRNAARVATDRLFVHLYLNAFKDERTVFWRVPLTDFRGDGLDAPGRIDVEKMFVRELGKDVWPDKPTTPGDPDDATDIEVPLPRAIQPGETITIDAAWTSHLPTVTIRTGYHGSFHMVAQWFPKLAVLSPDGAWVHFPFERLSEFYADYGAYDVTVIAPRTFTIGAVGALVSEGPAPDAQQDEHRFVAEDVHDFAFTAWDAFQALDDVSDAGVKIRCLFPRGYDAVARTEIDAVKHGLRHFGAAFGRYPYGTLTIVHPPSGAGEAGGMEYPTLITTGGSWLASPLRGREVEIVTLHELAHQWFYGLVGTNENRWPFLDEGLTSYAEADACEAAWPEASAGELFGLRVGLPAVYRAGALQSKRDMAVSEPASAFVSGEDYASLVYSRTETALRTLANVYGEDTLRRAIGLYARRNRFGHPGPDALFAAIREGVGEEAEAALRVALTQPSSVDYVAESVSSEPAADGKSHRGHVLVRRRGEIRLPVDVLLVKADGSSEIVRWAAAKEVEWLSYEGDQPLEAAVVDPEHRVLLDEDLSNNATRASGDRFAWRVLESASFGAGVLARELLP
ncbi:MAG: M1 family metallopeptidase [Polyangiaceae bacterium]